MRSVRGPGPALGSWTAVSTRSGLVPTETWVRSMPSRPMSRSARSSSLAWSSKAFDQRSISSAVAVRPRGRW